MLLGCMMELQKGAAAPNNLRGVWLVNVDLEKGRRLLFEVFLLFG